MAQFFKPAKKQKRTNQHLTVAIEQLDHECTGVGFTHNKTCFVTGALPGETVKAKITDDQKNHYRADVVTVVTASSDRKNPDCQHADVCGGCQLQHLTDEQQVMFKQQGVERLIKKATGLDTIQWTDSITADAWGYRRRARIGVWFDKKSKTSTVGFRRRGDKSIIQVDQCLTLVDEFHPIFSVFNALLPQLSMGRAVTHLEAIGADNMAAVIIRHTRPMSDMDRQLLLSTGRQHGWTMISEPDSGQYVVIEQTGNSTVPELSYQLNIAHEHKENITVAFTPEHFIQVNKTINQRMVAQALQWLNLSSDDIVLDLFCGVGNFSLAMAPYCQQVVGVEGVLSMIKQARYNAELNELSNISFWCEDLSSDWSAQKWCKHAFTHVLLDPARAGALQAVQRMNQLSPDVIVYVSCNPATFARDCKILLEQGYDLGNVSIMNMFPQTSHVELMAKFERRKKRRLSTKAG